MGLDISPLEVNTKVPSGCMVNQENHWPAQCPVSAVSGEEDIFFFLKPGCFFYPMAPLNQAARSDFCLWVGLI